MSSASQQASPSASTRDPIPGFKGGVNIAAAQDELASDQCRGLTNMILDENGGASKRLGIIPISSPGARIISMYVFYRGAALGPQVLVHLANGNFRYSNDNGATWTTAVASMSTINPMSWETFNGKCYMVNGVDPYQVWDGSAASVIPSAPVGKYLRVWKDTMWVAGTNDDRVYSSDPGNAEVYTTGNWVDLGKGDGDTVVGLATDGNVLIVPKRKRGFLIYDPTTFANRMFDPDKGAESHNSFVHFDQALYYMSRIGICIFLGDSPSQVISDNIAPIFQPEVINFNLTNLVWGYTQDNRIGWAVPEAGAGLPTLQIELLPRGEKKPFTFHRVNVGCFATLRTAQIERLLAGGTVANKLYGTFEGPDDDGAVYPGVIETKWFSLDDTLVVKYLRRIILTGRGTFYMGILTDYESEIKTSRLLDLSEFQSVWNGVGDVWGDEKWGPAATLSSTPIHPDIYGRAFSFRFSDVASGVQAQAIDVADVDYQIQRGSWSLYSGLMEVIGMGTDL